MIRCRGLTVGLLASTALLSLAVVAAGQSLPSSDPAKSIDADLALLGDPDWAKRQAAEERLVRRGDLVAARLAAIARSAEDGEVRARAAAAVARIEYNRALGATPITLKLNNVPAGEAVAELARQARGGLPTEPAGLFNQKTTARVSLTADQEPFWSVMQRFCAQSELEVTQITRGNREVLGLSRGTTEWMDKPIALAGPLMVRADRLTRTSAVRLKAPRQTTHEFNVSFAVFAEPKLRVLDYSSAVQLDRVVDERGNSLVPPADANGVLANAEVFGNSHDAGTSRWDVGATLHYPKGAGTKIAHLQARTTALVQTQSAAVSVPMAQARGAKREAGGLRATVKSVDANRAEFAVTRDGRDDADWYAVRMQLSAGEARLLNEQGQVVARHQGGLDIDDSVGADGQRMDVKVRFAREAVGDGIKGGGAAVPGAGGAGAAAATDGNRKRVASSEPVTFEFHFPTETVELSVPFEFRDLPIP